MTAAKVIPLHPRRASQDRVFFTKEQITPGVVLECHGRLNFRTRWRVVSIHTSKLKPSGDYTLVPIDHVRTLNDLITIEFMGEGMPQRRSRRARMMFSQMSYSAIWRVL